MFEALANEALDSVTGGSRADVLLVWMVQRLQSTHDAQIAAVTQSLDRLSTLFAALANKPSAPVVPSAAPEYALSMPPFAPIPSALLPVSSPQQAPMFGP